MLRNIQRSLTFSASAGSTAAVTPASSVSKYAKLSSSTGTHVTFIVQRSEAVRTAEKGHLAGGG